MSFFGKFGKTSVLHSGPPAPPRRTDNSSAYGWPEGEFDEEDGDTYEAPPCERPTIKAPPRQVEENVYLGFPDRSPNPVIPKRQAALPPRPAKILPIGKSTKPEPPHDPEEFYIDPNDGKPPEVIRKDKPGKKAPPKRPPMRPPPAPQQDEDVYLDPNEGQDDDDTYLEPVAEPPSPRNPIRVPMPPKSVGRDPLPPIMKPPVPRAHSSSLLVSDSLSKGPPPEIKIRSSTVSGQLPPPALNSKPVPPIIIPKELKPSPPPPPSLDSTAHSFGVKPAAQGAGLQDREWFAGVCDRKTAEETVFRINKDGTFLVRYSNSQNDRQPYTLVVLYRQTVYNIPVRFLEDSQHYALGKEGKKTEELFSSLQEMISHHMKNPLLLIDRKSQAKHSTHLSHPVRP
ncbi:B-cell linker protein isoform X1 [Ctenopharyngodon idella]|uniref:B-cell linker protein isoform X1 n=1 Tax=Ctenopharyngodon idella TaxID=7959 RepID=UPI002230A2E6|nr:B-cell linker protein isoform X1 [Ctenopharyngodon idella]XP_051759688.1 B-cell linker protein isoform X2 [Ctenopharyngodon idella]XP_051759689.1 B-cell linker protein isoform X1 [Ctenopharyngodon idella]